MRKFIALLIAAVLVVLPGATAKAAAPQFKLGNEVLYDRYHHLIEGRRVGLVTNQSGVNSQGISTIDVLASDPTVDLVALFGPEHGIDGTAVAGDKVESHIHPALGIPVYSLYGYGEDRYPKEEMMEDLDVILYDLQDVGSRTYTYISTLNYVMLRAAQYGKHVVILDRPNPVGCEIVEAPVLEDNFKTFVGVDNLPMAHGMTIGELARFFNRNIGCELTVVPMEGYTRDMVFQDTGLDWVQTSPNIPDIDSVFGYMATGLGEGTGIRQYDCFKWIGGKGIDSDTFAAMLNAANLPGVTYIPEPKTVGGGARLQITDYHTFNPAKSGLYALALAKQLVDFTVPKGGETPTTACMFDKVMGTNRLGKWLDAGLTPEQIEREYAEELETFKYERQKYLIYGYATPGELSVVVNNVALFFDSPPYIDSQNRTMVPLRAISEGLNAVVGWDPQTYTVTVEKDDLRITLSIGDDVAYVNGEKRIMDTIPVLKNDRTMVPIRFVAEFLESTVGWDEVNRMVTVSQ